ncbi:hypothetical protein D3C87_634000 [compost metagenome]
MSKIRIVNGTNTKVSEKGNNIYSTESIISNALNWISEVGEIKLVSLTEIQPSQLRRK